MSELATIPAAATDDYGIPKSPHGVPEIAAGDARAFFENLLDIINPLQHLPIVSSIYRAITGDEIAGPARLIGGAIYGGPLGAAGAAVNIVVDNITGSDIGEHMLALIDDDETAPTEQQASAGAMSDAKGRHEPATIASGDAGNARPAEPPVQIVWNSERRMDAAAPVEQAGIAPSTAFTTASTVGLPADSRAGTGLTLVESAIPQLPVAAALQKPELPHAIPAKSAWVAVALADAEQNHDAVESGRGRIPNTPPAWIATAMEQALDKYQAMALARATSAPNAPVPTLTVR